MKVVRCFVVLVLAATSYMLSASAQSNGGSQLTDLLTPAEKSAAGLSKLSPSELRALNAALFRVILEISEPTEASKPASGGATAAGDVNLFNSGGKAAAYLDSSEGLTFYLWSGEPVAYLDGDSVYGFNGKHLGWYRDGVVYDEGGDIVAAPPSALHAAVEVPPLRGLKGLKPLKGLKELKPLRPLFQLAWSQTPALAFFLQGIE